MTEGKDFTDIEFLRGIFTTLENLKAFVLDSTGSEELNGRIEGFVATLNELEKNKVISSTLRDLFLAEVENLKITR